MARWGGIDRAKNKSWILPIFENGHSQVLPFMRSLNLDRMYLVLLSEYSTQYSYRTADTDRTQYFCVTENKRYG